MTKLCMTRWLQFFMVTAILTVSFQATAATVSYYLDQSNITALPDGTNYLKVTISDSVIVSGNIDFKVETLFPLTSIATGGFGIDQFGFNTNNNTLTSSNFVLPSQWSYIGVGNMDGFGKFELRTDTNGSANRLSVLNFSVTGISGDTVMDYVMLSAGNAGQGNTFFASHVAGFNASGTTSAYFGGSTPVPVPASVWLFGSGLMGIASLLRKKKTLA